MARGDWDVRPNNLTVPPFAGPGTPRVVIGPDVPPELEAWVAANFLQHCYYAQLAYDTTGGYIFAAYCYSDAIQIPQQINGYVDSALVPHLFWIQGWNIAGAAGEVSIGSSVVAGQPFNLYTLTKLHNNILSAARADLYAVNATAGSTASLAFVDFPGPKEVTLVKTEAATNVVIAHHGTCYVAGAANDGVEFAVREGASDFQTTGKLRMANLMLNSHTPYTGGTRIGGLAAGSHTFRLRWRTQAANNITVDNDDAVALIAMEVAT